MSAAADCRRLAAPGPAAGLAFLAVAVACAMAAAPEPAAAPVEWELRFRYEVPQRIQVRLPGEPKPITYWYMLYHVENDGDEERDFLPVIERVSEIESELPAERVRDAPHAAARIEVTPSLVGLDPLVFKAIQARHARTHPFLVPPVQAIGRVKVGADNAIDSVAVFPDLDPRVSRFTIYVGGLSGERTRIPNPSFNAGKPEDERNARWFVLQKTLVLPFRLPGDESTRRYATPAPERLSWVMR